MSIEDRALAATTTPQGPDMPLAQAAMATAVLLTVGFREHASIGRREAAA